MSMLLNPFWFDTGGGGIVTPLTPSVFTKSAVLRTTAGTQNITIPGIGTPQLAIIHCVRAVTDATPRNTGSVSTGFYDGTNQYCTSFHDRNSADGSYSVGRTDAVIHLHDTVGSAQALKVSATAFITDGITLNVSDPDLAYLVYVEFWVNPGWDFAVGQMTPGGIGSPVTENVGFEPNLLFGITPLKTTWDTIANPVHNSDGFATWDGVSVRQVCRSRYSSTPGGTTDIRAQIRNDAFLCAADSGRRIVVSNFTATGFDAASVAFDSSTLPFAYVAIGFNGSGEAWCGITDIPMATGNHDFTDSLDPPDFTPFYGSILISGTAAVNTVYTDNSGSCWARSVAEDDAQFCYTQTERDAQTGNQASCQGSLKVIDAGYTPSASFTIFVEGDHVGFDVGKYTVNITDGAPYACKAPTLFVR